MITFHSRSRFLDTSTLYFEKQKLNYASNPLIIETSEQVSRLFFNSRDECNRSSIYSIDLQGEELIPISNSIKLQHTFGRKNSFYSHGISIGNSFELNKRNYVGVMGWKNNPGEHWSGRIGKVELDSSGNLEKIDEKVWFDLDADDPISLSYPAIYQDGSTLSMWYGSTVTWDSGNGEMLHILKEKRSQDGINFMSSASVIPFKIDQAQAFSRPSIVNFNNRNLMAYSFRGSSNKYRIGFVWLDDFSTATQVGGLPPFLPSRENWENEMVEYPSLFVRNKKLFMLYNGNDYGKTGIGMTQITIQN
jgi:hypothetical protein